MLIDVYEFMYHHNQKFSDSSSNRELGKNAFYSIVEIGASYEDFKNAFIETPDTSFQISYETLDAPFTEDDYVFQTLLK